MAIGQRYHPTCDGKKAQGRPKQCGLMTQKVDKTGQLRED